MTNHTPETAAIKPRVFKMGLRRKWWVRTPENSLYAFPTWREAMDRVQRIRPGVATDDRPSGSDDPETRSLPE